MAVLQAQARLRAVQRRRPPRRSPRPWESRPTVRRGHGMHKPSRPRAYVRRRRSQRGRRARRGPFSGSRTRRRRFRARRPRARGRRSAARARRRRDDELGRLVSSPRRRPGKCKRRVRVRKPWLGALRAGGDAAERRRRGASYGRTASTASCGHCGHAGRASSATFGVCGVLFLCKECRPAHESTVLRHHSRTG